MTGLGGISCAMALLAQEPSRVVSFSEPIRRGSAAEMDWGSLATAVLLLLAAVLIGTWTARTVQIVVQRWRHGRARLFLDLCRAHELSRNERRMLQQLARAHRLRSAAELFLAPERFDAQHLSPALAEHESELHGLRMHLFGSPAPLRRC